jgi:hypothetical protein
MIEYFCIGFVMGVIIALVQPLLWATVNKWKKKEPPATTPILSTPRPTGKQWSYDGFRSPYGWQHIYTLTDFDGLEPTFVAKIWRLDKDAQGYWRFFRKNGQIEEGIVDVTFEQACKFAKDRTGVDGPNPVHLGK